MDLTQIEVWLDKHLGEWLDAREGATMAVVKSETELVATFTWMRHKLVDIIVHEAGTAGNDATEVTVRFLEVELAPTEAMDASQSMNNVANLAEELETALTEANDVEG